jgi:FMN phosphatase YigB (HAD superfamily)
LFKACNLKHMIRAIIFDCFGVLAVDGWGPFKQRYFVDRPDKFREIAAIGRLVDAGKCSVDVLITAIARSLKMNESAVREAINRREPHDELFTYIRQELRPQYKIGLLSNASYDIRTQLFTPDQNAVFDAGVLSYDVGLTKSGPEMYYVVARELGVEPAECIMVDDQERYCDAARQAGMQAILYENPEQLRRLLDAVVK